MELQDLTQALTRMTEGELRSVARALDSHTLSPGDDVDAWRATISIDRALRREHRTRAAANAAHSASQAVLSAARNAGIALPDPDVTHVARAAAELARATVAGSSVGPDIKLLVDCFVSVAALA